MALDQRRGAGLNYSLGQGGRHLLISMDDGARHWLLRTARANLWRVANSHDIDDLLQDGCLVWYKVVNRYVNQNGRVRLVERPHLMALFKRSYINHLHDLSRAKRKNAETPVSDLMRERDSNVTSEYDIWDRYVKAPADDLDHATLLAEMDPIAKQAILIMESDEGARLLRRAERYRLGFPKDTPGNRMRRAMGLGDDIDVLDRVKTALHSV